MLDLPTQIGLCAIIFVSGICAGIIITEHRQDKIIALTDDNGTNQTDSRRTKK